MHADINVSGSSICLLFPLALCSLDGGAKQ